MKYRANSQDTWHKIKVKALDSMPVGTIVDYDGQASNIPSGWEQVSGQNKIKKITETAPTQASVVGTYNNSQTDSYSCNFLNNSIIETGSNTYGSWIKYGNGVMICSRSLTGTININEAWGDGYVGHNSTEYAFSQTFIEPPIVQRTLYTTGDTSFIPLEWDPVQITTTYIKNIGFYRPTSSVNDVSFRYDFIAIGKWK